MTIQTIDLNRRELSILRAVAAGRGKLVSSCEPALAVDGRWCDHMSVHRLVVEGLIQPARPVSIGRRASAIVTSEGYSVLSEAFGSTSALAA